MEVFPVKGKYVFTGDAENNEEPLSRKARKVNAKRMEENVENAKVDASFKKNIENTKVYFYEG